MEKFLFSSASAVRSPLRVRKKMLFLHIQWFSTLALSPLYRLSLLLTLEVRASLVDFSARVLLRRVRIRWKVRALRYCEQSRSQLYFVTNNLCSILRSFPKTWKTAKRKINFSNLYLNNLWYTQLLLTHLLFITLQLTTLFHYVLIIKFLIFIPRDG